MHPALADEHFLRAPAERQDLAAARLVSHTRALQAPSRPRSAPALSSARAGGSPACSSFECAGLHPALAEAVAAGAWSRILPCAKPLNPAAAAVGPMPALRHGRGLRERGSKEGVIRRSRCVVTADGLVGLEAPMCGLVAGAAAVDIAGAEGTASSACCDRAVRPTCAVGPAACLMDCDTNLDGLDPGRKCGHGSACELGAAARPSAGPFGYCAEGDETFPRAQQGQGNEGGAPGHLCGTGTEECAQHGSRHDEGGPDHLRAASSYGTAQQGCAAGALGDLCGTAAGLAGRIGELQAAVRALRLARCPGAAAGPRSLADYLAAASAARQGAAAEAHAAGRGAGLPGQLGTPGSRSLADHLAAASAAPRPGYQLLPPRQPSGMLPCPPDEAKSGARLPAACLANTGTASADGGPARTAAHQGMARRRAVPASRADGVRAAACRRAQTAARPFADGLGIGGRAESLRHQLPAVRWLSPQEPLDPAAPAACPGRLRASATLEDVPAFSTVAVGGAAAWEKRAGPAGMRLSGAKRRAGAEADAAFAAFLQRSQQRAAAAERVRR